MVMMKISKTRAGITTESRENSPDELERGTIETKQDFESVTGQLNAGCGFYSK